jgi:hypothetical protein
LESENNVLKLVVFFLVAISQKKKLILRLGTWLCKRGPELNLSTKKAIDFKAIH